MKFTSDKSKEITNKVKELLEEKGREPLNAARNLIFKNKSICKEIRDALKYFMYEYWNDLTTPTLLCLSCEAVGGSAYQVKHIAIPLIMISGAIDIHDDIIDQSTKKEGKLTVFGKFGSEIAIITGNFLLVEGFTLLNKFYNKLPRNKSSHISKIIMNSLFELANAEALEISLMKKLHNGKRVKPEEYLQVIELKAGDIEGLFKIGAILGGGSKAEITLLGQYGRYLGMLSILRDDLMDLKDFREIKHRIKYEILPYALLCALQNFYADSNTFTFIKFLKSIKRVNDLWDVVIKSNALKKHKELMEDIAAKGYSILNNLNCNKKNLKLLLDFLALT